MGICGGSCSGKSTLVQRVRTELNDLAPVALCFDWYYRPLSHMTLAQRDRVNFDHPDSLDGELFVEHLRALKAGRPVDRPVYDFATHSRASAPERISPSSVVLVDGVLLLALPEAVELLDYSVFVDAPADLRLQRRIARDTVERGRSEESVRRQFEESVAPMHARFVAPSASRASRIVGSDEDFDAVAASLGGVVRTHLCGGGGLKA